MGPTPQHAPARDSGPSGLRRAGMLLAMLLVAWAGVEVLCTAAFRVLRDGGFDAAALSALRAERRAPGAAGALAGPALEVIHPYLGFVYDPEADDAARRDHHGGLPVSDFGFLDDAPPLRPASDDAVVVGIFGGSFAYFLSLHGVDALVAGLQQLPAYRGRDVSVVRVALGGYKQPQQLIALAYLLSLGAHFDVVIEVDGFNEVALPPAENVPKGVFPFFPRNWSGRVAGVPDHAGLDAMVRIADLRRRRAAWAERIEGSLLRRSPAANLVWWLRDRALAVDLARAQVALAEVEQRAPGYRARGPRRDYADAAGLYDDLAAMWYRSSLAMHRLCAASGIAYWHFLQPNQYVAGSKPMGDDERRVAFAAPQFYRDEVEQGYPRLRARGADLAAAGVRFHDLTGVFGGVTEPLYSDSCCHVNPRGYVRVGEAMAAHVAADLAAGGRGPAGG